KDGTRRAFYEERFALLNECWAEYQALDGVMDAKFERQTPGLGATKKTLDSIRTLIEKLVKEKRILEPYPGEIAEEAEGGGGTEGEGVGTGPGGPLRSRADALMR